jgi:hypothetical protein
MPISGRVPPFPTEAASRVPTNGPTHANEASEKVRPIRSVPPKPPFSVERLSRVRMDEGMVISKAPSRLRPNVMNSAEIKPLTHGLEPSCTTPKGPSSAVISRPIPEKSTMIPRQKTTACVTPSPLPADCRFRKNDMVIGIIGKTHGVKIEASPKPKATSRNPARLWSELVEAGTAVLPGAGGLASAKPAGMTGAAAPGVTFRAAVPEKRDGTHCVSLQVW